MGEEVFAFVAFFIFFGLLVSITVSFGVARKKMKNEQSKNKAQSTSVDDNPVTDEDLDNLDKMLQDEDDIDEDILLTELEEVVPLEKIEQKQVKHHRKKLFEKHRINRKDVVAVDDTNSQVVTEQFEKEQHHETPHTHPVATPSKNEKIIVEKVPDTSGSLGKVSDEGCSEHGNLRYVLKEVESKSSSQDKNLTELQRLIVWSEVLGKPKFKKY